MDKNDPENLLHAAEIFMEIGRFFQELTIDAAKTAVNVNIPYFQNIQKTHLVSRQLTSDLFNAKILWNGIEELENLKEAREERKESAENTEGFEAWKRRNINYNFSIPKCGVVFYGGQDTIIHKDKFAIKYVLADEAHKMRVESIKNIAKSTSELGSHEQKITPEFKAFVTEKAKGLEKYFATMKIANDMYKSVSTAKQQLLESAKAEYVGLDEELLEAKLKFTKKYLKIDGNTRS